MPPPTGSAVIDDNQPTPTTSEKYIDVDRLENSDRLVAVFSQRSWDGLLTFGFHREFERYDQAHKQLVTSKTGFVPESLAESFADFALLAVAHLEKLKARRAAGDLPFPEGGIEAKRREARRHRP